MPHLTLPLSPAGAALDVFIGVSDQRRAALVAAQQKIPDFIQVRMIIDTGATGTAVEEDVLKALGLTPTGTTQILTPSTKGTPVTCPTYDILIGVYHAKYSLVLATAPVFGSDFTGQGIQGLIGCDILSQCLFMYDGVAGQFSIAF